jgi:hypothetical protein
MSRRASSLPRRAFLAGAGVTLALPWLESLAPRRARGQTALARRRFVAMVFPNGVADFWKPTGGGAGSAWGLSPILEPLAPLKKQVTVLGHVGNYSPWGGHVEPSHGNLMGAYLTCIKASGPSNNNRGISVDQVIAKRSSQRTPLQSLQVGLSTLDSYTDGLPGSHSRSISWASESEPLYKVVSPQKLFDKMFAPSAVPAGSSDADRSILDQVLAQAQTLQGGLSKTDRTRLDEFLTSVREVEKSVAGTGSLAGCTNPVRPTQDYAVMNVPPDYDRGAHADQMLDLVALALQCDLTRVVSFMFDDARSDFVYSFLTERLFTATGSAPGTASCGSLHGASSSGNTNNGWATINRWFIEKLARFCTKLQAMPEDGGSTVLDQSVVWCGSEMHGGNHDGLDLPLLYVGSGGGRLKADQFVDFGARPMQLEHLSNVYLTFLRNVFDLGEMSFGVGMGQFADAGKQTVSEILK